MSGVPLKGCGFQKGIRIYTSYVSLVPTSLELSLGFRVFSFRVYAGYELSKLFERGLYGMIQEKIF